MKIEVTQKHIEAGIVNCDKCPVALAMTDAGISKPSVCAVVMYADGQRFIPPLSVETFVRRFDKHLPVAPFQFDLDLNK